MLISPDSPCLLTFSHSKPEPTIVSYLVFCSSVIAPLWYICALQRERVMQNIHIEPFPTLAWDFLHCFSSAFSMQTRILTETCAAWRLPPFLPLQTQGTNSLPAALTCSLDFSLPVPPHSGHCGVLLHVPRGDPRRCQTSLLHPVTSCSVFKIELKYHFLKEALPVSSDLRSPVNMVEDVNGFGSGGRFVSRFWKIYVMLGSLSPISLSVT